MSSLSQKNIMVFEELFCMQSGYVLDFTNSQFASFVYDTIHIKIYSNPGYEEYCSKANKLRQIWQNESDHTVGVLLTALLDYCEDYYLKKEKMTDYRKKKISDMQIVANHLQNSYHKVPLPTLPEEAFQTLSEAIDNALANNTPELALDRLHTFATKMIREICKKNDIPISDDKGNNYPLHSLVGSLSKKYEATCSFQSEFTSTALKNCISLFEKFNKVRNDESYAHDNMVLQKSEAEFVVRIMAAVLTFIHNLNKIQSMKATENKEDFLFLF